MKGLLLGSENGWWIDSLVLRMDSLHPTVIVDIMLDTYATKY